MAQQQTTKRVFDLSGGLNTELHDLAWPDGFTEAEANYELLSDGTRRRRKGLATEASAGSEHELPTHVATQANQSYKWKNVGGDPNKSFLVHQIGLELYFTNDDTNPSASWHSELIPVLDHSAETSPSDANYRDNFLRFSQGRGHLFVTGPYIKPFYVKYDATADTFDSVAIGVRYRDFEGIGDDVGITSRPTDDPILADHRYNLRNRGWIDADLATILAAANTSPSKAGLWYAGYQRATLGSGDGLTRDSEGVRGLVAAKYAGEAFGNSSSPQGSLFLNPFDTRFSADASGEGAKAITAVVVGTAVVANTSLKISITGHGFTNGDSVTITGHNSIYLKQIGHGSNTRNVKFSLDGTHTIRDKNANDFEITIVLPANWVAWVNLELALGEVAGGVALAKSDGSLVQRGFEAIGFFAGRVWYAGLADSQFADHIFFSRICESPAAYGRCHQRQDPTDETFNDLTPADGGVLIVPNLNGVKDMMVIGNSLVLVGTEGAWEVTGPRGTGFSATNFNVRQLTNANFNSPTGAIPIDSVGMAVGPSGIYQFAPNEFTRLLEAKNMIVNTIQTKWNGYTTAEQARAQVVYDDAKQRVYIMIGATAADNDYDELLIFDVRKSAWFIYTFAPTSAFKLLSLVAITAADNSADNQKMKFLYQSATDKVQWADFQQTDYLDFDGNESPLPFMVSGFDNLGDFQRRKQAPVITVFSKRTETGYVAVGGEGGAWDPVNPSSTLMTAFWDWTENVEYDRISPITPTKQQTWTGTANNHGVSGKIGAQSEVYRHARNFVPLLAGDVDGYPTVVTRNKVRGRGRVLQLRFDGAATKDSHIIGWSTNYKVEKRV